ncbi:ArnT family glycosyltransferase [Tenuifilum osseticum]|uniref:ArnT family glycosyltransferase n=1 Tax=Tenuifilum osseticum TaxID=3374723 RepID=UPI0034E4D615
MITRKTLKDIRFWIFVLFIIRLIGITNPPLEVGHNWRQTTVIMVARNFLEVDNNIFYPRIDIAGEKSGITGMEFPLLNYLIYIIAKIFGYQHWYGRLINLIISSIGLFYFYKLIRKYFSEQVAFPSTIVLAVSIWFQFSRKIMPDTFSMSLITASIFFGSNYLENTLSKNNSLNLICYGVLMPLGVLSKLPSGFLLVIFVFFLFDRSIPIKRKVIFSTVSLIGVLPVIVWYYYWVPYLVDKYGFWHFFMGKGISQGFNEILLNINETLSKFYDTALKFIGFGVFLFGLGYSFIKSDSKILYLFILTFISFSIIILKAGFTFSHHNYYIIPFVPVMALVAGYGLSKIKYSKLAIILLIAISVEGIANQQHDFRIKEKDMHLLNLEKDLDSMSFRNDLIIINSGSYPTPMYFAHRKGWVNTNDKIRDEEYIMSLKGKGLKYIVILKRSFGTATSLNRYRKVLENEDYSIYEL